MSQVRVLPGRHGNTKTSFPIHPSTLLVCLKTVIKIFTCMCMPETRGIHWVAVTFLSRRLQWLQMVPVLIQLLCCRNGHSQTIMATYFHSNLSQLKILFPHSVYFIIDLCIEHSLYICIFYCILWPICDTEIKFLYHVYIDLVSLFDIFHYTCQKLLLQGWSLQDNAVISTPLRHN